jgi:hypothetical protein
VIRLVDALHDASTLDDGLWAEASTFFTEAQLLDLLTLAG